MPMGLMFWILMLIWFVFGLLVHFAVIGGIYASGGSTVLLFVLFLLLGWKTFGPPLQ